MGQFHSISVSGMALFAKPIESTIGGVEIDLASAPIDPGEHELHVDVAIGGIEIYVPSYVKLTVEGGAVVGGYDVHNGLGLLGRLDRRFRRLFRTSNQIPAQSVPAPADPIMLKLVIDGGVGGVDVYRLPPSA